MCTETLLGCGCRLSGARWGLRLCISNQVPGREGAVGLQTTPGIDRLSKVLLYFWGTDNLPTVQLPGRVLEPADCSIFRNSASQLTPC